MSKEKKNSEAEEIARKNAEAGIRESGGEQDSKLAAVGAGGITGAAAGAVIGGAVGGPVGAAIGATAGAVAGGAAADQVQNEFDPKQEELFWRKQFVDEPYYKKGDKYEDYLPAYRFGWEAAVGDEFLHNDFEEIEPRLQDRWKQHYADRHWDSERERVRAAYIRIRERQLQPKE